MNDDEIEALCEAATPGPWTTSGYEYDASVHDPTGTLIYDEGGHSVADALFIAASRSLVPDLLERAQRAESFVREMADLDNWIGNGVGSTSQEQWQMDIEHAIAERARAHLPAPPVSREAQ